MSIPYRASLVVPSEPLCAFEACCDGCGERIANREAAWVTYYHDDAGEADGFRLVHRDAACRGHAPSVGAFVNSRGMSLAAFLSADAVGVWNDRVKRSSVRNPLALRIFLLRVRMFGYSIHS